ncbi:MAG: S24/S26 family peptidase [Elusimicrobia bacterium]|nr:S24/S26 family peptidase [Elusimicrobiota bacterium]
MIPLTRRFAFQGDSMLPLLESGDEVWVRAVPLEDAEPGDLLVWARFQGAQPALVVHRLLGVGRSAGGELVARTRGDARLHDDEPFGAGEFLGKVVALRRGGSFVDLQSCAGRLYDGACRFCAGVFLRGGTGGSRLRRAVLAPSRLLLKALGLPAGDR